MAAAAAGLLLRGNRSQPTQPTWIGYISKKKGGPPDESRTIDSERKEKSTVTDRVARALTTIFLAESITYVTITSNRYG